MPQHPASRSVTVAPGMRDSRAAAGAARPIERWWQCTCSSMDEGPARSASRARPAASSRSRYSSKSTDWRPTTRAFSRIEPLNRSGASSRTADRQLGSTNTIGVAARGTRVERGDVARRQLARIREQALRDERPAAAARGARALAPMPARSRTFEGRHADLRLDVRGEGVGEEHGARPGRVRARRGQAIAQASAGPSAAAWRRRSMPTSASATDVPGALRRQGSSRCGAKRLPHGGQLVDVAESAGLQRHAVPARSSRPGTRSCSGRRPRRPGTRSCRPGTRGTGRARSCTPSSSSPASLHPPAHGQAQHVGAPARGVRLVARRHVGRAHRAASRVLRQAPTPLHISTARPKPPNAA